MQKDFALVQVLQQALNLNHICSHSTACVTSAQTTTFGALPAPPGPADSQDDPVEPGALGAELTLAHRSPSAALLGPHTHSSSLWHRLLQLLFLPLPPSAESTNTPEEISYNMQHPVTRSLRRFSFPATSTPAPLLLGGEVKSFPSEMTAPRHQPELPTARPGHP